MCSSDLWGMSEWTGRWSDGSKEWTQEWLEILPKLGHTFGDDGQFVMECELFLKIPHYSVISILLSYDSNFYERRFGLAGKFCAD